MTNRTCRKTLPAIMAAAAGTLGLSGTLAMAVEPTQQELMAQLEELKAKVAALESQQQQQQQISAQDVDATVASVLADADRRSQLLQAEGFTAGYNKGKFLIQSADGNFSLNPNAQFQFRYVANYADNADGDDEEISEGFEVRRMKFGLAGNLFSKDLSYNFVWASERSGEDVVVDPVTGDTDSIFGGSLLLEDAFVTYQFADQWAVRLGQYKVATHHEELVSSKRQLTVDRSLLNELIGGGQTDRMQGVSLVYGDGGPLRAEFGFGDGVNTDNTNALSDDGGSGFVGSPDFNLGGRVEYMVVGDNWKAYEDFTAKGNKSDILVVGGGANWTQSGDDNAYHHTVDVQYETGALGLYAAYVGVLNDLSDATAAGGEDSIYDMGLLVQAGYMLNDKWEVFARYDVTFLDEDRDADDDQDDIHEITAGVNYYWHSHNAKFTLDAFWLPEGTPSGSSGIGVISQDDEDDQFGLRAQFQLLL